MNTHDAAFLARTLMDAFGLADWQFRFDHARRRAGMTDFGSKTISLSQPLTQLYDDALVRRVILHEIAHALVGRNHGHDASWRAVASRIGADPHASLRNAPQLEAPWVGICPRGHRTTRFRRPTRPMSCAQCSKHFDRRYLFNWYFHGERVSVG
ncbi:MAG: SprT-like domain-containing protein [Actinomycetaceae bacterium]|nr:SprT-like domain-containing protein [Actinomycetaceae bacterium]MDY6082363.1 SprT-like domain-containing protein [Actinomycetaceae bacterium]